MRLRVRRISTSESGLDSTFYCLTPAGYRPLRSETSSLALANRTTPWPLQVGGGGSFCGDCGGGICGTGAIRGIGETGGIGGGAALRLRRRRKTVAVTAAITITVPIAAMRAKLAGRRAASPQPPVGAEAVSGHKGFFRDRLLALFAAPVANSVSQKCEQYEDGVLPSSRQPVGHQICLIDPIHEAFFLHLVEPAREHSRRESGIVPEDLAESVQLQEGHVAQDQKSPFPTQTLHALPDRIGLIRQEGSDRAIASCVSTVPRHYPLGP